MRLSIPAYSACRYEGPAIVTIAATLDTVPVFVKAGSIIPTAAKALRSRDVTLDTLTFDVYPGESGEFRLYNDDGDNINYATGGAAVLEWH